MSKALVSWAKWPWKSPALHPGGLPLRPRTDLSPVPREKVRELGLQLAPLEP